MLVLVTKQKQNITITELATVFRRLRLLVRVEKDVLPDVWVLVLVKELVHSMQSM